MPYLAVPLQDTAHAEHKEGHVNTALLQKFSECCYLVRVSAQALLSCLPFLLPTGRGSIRMQVLQGARALEYSILARFLACFFSFWQQFLAETQTICLL